MPNILPKITIAIDGFSSTGKSTVAKRLAKELHYIYVDTGAMYRAVTLYGLEEGFIDKDKFDIKGLVESLKKIHIQFKYNKELGFAEMFLNDKNVEREIRSLHISNFVSPVAAVPEVRKYLVELQRKMGKGKAVVMDGRDIGSVVFPDAELKIFLTADAKVRAERRYLEMQEKNIKADFKTIYDNLIKRDEIDSNRTDSPLVKVADAVEIDATNINKEEQFNSVLILAHKAILDKKAIHNFKTKK
jgi:cytidylate kinase